MWAALRHRRGQALALALVAALVSTCAAFAPILARSIDQALLRTHITESAPEENSASITRARTASERETMPESVVEALPAEATDVSAEPISGMRHSAGIVPAKGKLPSPVVLRSRSRVCEHLEINGRCPRSSGEVLVSSADAQAWGWDVRTSLTMPQEKHPRAGPEPPKVELTVVGTYEVAEGGEDYWLGGRPDGKSGLPHPDWDYAPGMDDLLTPEATFAKDFETAEVTVDLPLAEDRATLDSMPAAARALSDLGDEHPEVTVAEPASAIVEDVSTGRGQTAVIVGFVALQLTLLALLVLFLVASATVDQRRHDVALARLRGRSRTGARRRLLAELAVPVLLGLPIGFLCALGLAALVRWLLLPHGIPFEVPAVVGAWLLGALLVSMLAVRLAARPLLGESVNDLLRSVAPRREAGSKVVETVVVVLAVVGALGLATGALSGPAALAAPTLLAIAVGLVGARVVPIVASGRARAAMRRGRVAPALAAHGIGRRPAARRALAVTTVAVAVAVFGVNAVVVADENRMARAQLETGAPAVVEVDSTSVPELLAAADALADAGIEASPVASISPREQGAARTMAIDPGSIRGVAHPATLEELDLEALALPQQSSIRLTGDRVTGSLTWDLRTKGVDEPAVLVLDLTTREGDRRSVDLARLGPGARGSADIDKRLSCSDRCRLDGLRVTGSGGPGASLDGDLTVTGLSVDGQALPVTGQSVWTSTGREGSPGITPSTKGEKLQLDLEARDGADISTRVTDVPSPLPAIVSGDVAEKGEELSVIDIAAGQTEVSARQHVDAVPAATDQGVVISLRALARVNEQIDPRRTATSLWLADASPQGVAQARQVLADADVPVGSVATTAEAERVYDHSASGWGLQLALVGGVLAVLLAALVLVVLTLTGWRTSARDLAALRVSGVSTRDIATALRVEHLVTVAVGVSLGTVCALLGSWIALPSIPLFTHETSVPVADLTPAWSVVGVAALVLAAVLCAVAVALAGSVRRRVRPSLVRGEPG